MFLIREIKAIAVVAASSHYLVIACLLPELGNQNLSVFITDIHVQQFLQAGGVWAAIARLNMQFSDFVIARPVICGG